MSLKLFFALSLAVCWTNALPQLQRAAPELVSEAARGLQNLVNALDRKDLEHASHLGIEIIIDPDVFLPSAKLALAFYDAGFPYSVSCYVETALRYGLMDKIFIGMELWVLLVDDIDRYTSAYVQCYTQGGAVTDPTQEELHRCKTDISALFSAPAKEKALRINSILEEVIPGFPILALCINIPTI